MTRRRVAAALVLFVVASACSGGGDGGVSVGAEGGSAEGPSGARLVMPAGSVGGESVVELIRSDREVPASDVVGAAGEALRVEIQGDLAGSVTLELPFDRERLPAGAEVVAAVWVAAMGGWVPVGGTVDYAAGVVRVETDHLSEWIALWMLLFLVRTAVAPSGPSPGESGLRYVALGDSYSAGEGVRGFEQGTDETGNRCHRSLLAFPRLVAAELPIEGVSRACSGAKTVHVTTEDFEGEAPQIEWLGQDTELVTVTIGGNDIGFADIVIGCLTFSCVDLYQVAGGSDIVSQQIAALEPRLVATYQAIADAAPHAKVLVLGYPHLFAQGQAAGCVVGYTPEEMEWIREKVEELNSTIREATQAVPRVRYVNVINPSDGGGFAGHELCTAEPWLTGLVVSLPDYAFSMHPTEAGQQGLATITLNAVTDQVTAGTTTEPGTDTAAELCVVGRRPGEVARVRTGPGSEFEVVGELAFDATGIRTTGQTAIDRDGDEWREIIYHGESRWVVARFLTPGACSVGQSVSYSVTGIACDDQLNVRAGIDEPHEIITKLAPDATGISGTGVTALDRQGRTWIQINANGQTGWAAGWYLTAGPAGIECADSTTTLSSTRTLCEWPSDFDSITPGPDPDRSMATDLDGDGVDEMITMAYTGGSVPYDWLASLEIRRGNQSLFTTDLESWHGDLQSPRSWIAVGEFNGVDPQEVVFCDFSIPGNWGALSVVVAAEVQGLWREVLRIDAVNSGPLEWWGVGLFVVTDAGSGLDPPPDDQYFFHWDPDLGRFEGGLPGEDD